MASINLDRINFLVVDDSEFAIRLISNVLYKLGAQKILTAKGGMEAVEILKQVSKSPEKLGVQSIDVVISDWVMPQIDGAMLLRWIRRHPESPNRFMPFIMISGMADPEKVAEARFLGVNEFLAKPFSIGSATDKLRMIINNPRRFIYNYEYFGPDRRRQTLEFKGADKRVIKKEETEIVYSGKTPETLSKKPKVWFFQLPNRLKELTASLGEKGESADFDPEVLEIAENEVQALEEDYIDWVSENLNKMFGYFDQIKLEMPAADIVKLLNKINPIAHEVRGQGSTFGYPLITRFNQSLFECTRLNDIIDQSLIDLIRAHMDGIKVVMRDRIKDEGGEIGSVLLKSLEEANTKYRNAQRKRA